MKLSISSIGLLSGLVAAWSDGVLCSQPTTTDEKLEHHDVPASFLDQCTDYYDPDDCDMLSHAFDAPSTSRSSAFGRSYTSTGEPGSRCEESSNCKNDFSCQQGRCLPGAESCLGKAISNFTEVFDSDAWTSSVFHQAGVGGVDIESDSFSNLQQSEYLRALIPVVKANIPDEVYDLQNAVNKCDMTLAVSVTTNDAAIADRAPTTPGTIVYMGLHFELSVIADLAASIFWAVGDNPEPTGFVRGTFGAELGLGAEASALLGFAFTSTTGDIQEGAVVTDIDAGFGPHIGMAVVANLNGLVSLEFTFGAGAGAGLGLGYSITSALKSTSEAPSAGPISLTVSPTKMPTTAAPSSIPSQEPSVSMAPSMVPSEEPSMVPSEEPSMVPSEEPSVSMVPSMVPSEEPSVSMVPSMAPSMVPSEEPSTVPSQKPSMVPSEEPSASMVPSMVPSEEPSASMVPSMVPSQKPSKEPSMMPSLSMVPSMVPSEEPSSSMEPSQVPSLSSAPTQCEYSDPVPTDPFWIVCGRPGNCGTGANETTAAVGEFHEIRCCSDDMLPGWTKNDGCNVYAESFFDPNGNTCYSESTYAVALRVCFCNGGTRLCTKAELLAGCTAGTGCAFDNDFVWSSTKAI